jgi:hypothetical protein
MHSLEEWYTLVIIDPPLFPHSIIFRPSIMTLYFFLFILAFLSKRVIALRSCLNFTSDHLMYVNHLTLFYYILHGK